MDSQLAALEQQLAIGRIQAQEQLAEADDADSHICVIPATSRRPSRARAQTHLVSSRGGLLISLSPVSFWLATAAVDIGRCKRAAWVAGQVEERRLKSPKPRNTGCARRKARF